MWTLILCWLPFSDTRESGSSYTFGPHKLLLYQPDMGFPP